MGNAWGRKNCGTSGCFEKIEIQQQLPEKYFIVFPSASLPVKQWPIERFAEITRRIYKKQAGHWLYAEQNVTRARSIHF